MQGTFIVVKLEEIKRLAILTDNLAAGQKQYFLIKSLNLFLTDHPNCDIIVFYKTCDVPCILPNFCTMRYHEVWHWRHSILVTDIAFAEKALKLPQDKQILFYVYDLEWLYNTYKSQTLFNIFRNPKIKLITRSEYYKQTIESCFNSKVDMVMPTWNFPELMKLV